MSKLGTIRSKEAKDVVEDVFRRNGLSRSLYSYRSGAFHILVGNRPVKLETPRGLTFYGLQALQQRAEAICRDIEKARLHRNQIDLEDAIEAAE
jgi:hypothetical protein